MATAMPSSVTPRQLTRLSWPARTPGTEGDVRTPASFPCPRPPPAQLPALTCTVALHGIPDVAIEVVVASEQQPAAAREGNRGDAADDVVMGIHEELLVGPQVKEAARGVVRARGEGIAVGEELQDTRPEWDEGAGQGQEPGKDGPAQLAPELTATALMSDSWPMKVCRHIESRTSHSLMEASQAPDTKVRPSGARDRDITSPLCPAKPTVCWPVSMSHRALEGRQEEGMDQRRMQDRLPLPFPSTL